MKRTLKTTLLPLVTAMIWGTAFVAQDMVADSVPPMTFNAIRFTAAVLFLLLVKAVIGLFRRGKGTKTSVENTGPACYGRKSFRMLAAAGALCGLALGVASILQQAGMTAGTDAGKSGFITAMYVVFVPVGGLLLKKRLPKLFWAALATAVAGLYLLCVNGGFRLASGDLLTLLCAVAFTVQILLIDRFAGRLDPIWFCIAEFCAAAAVSAVGMLLFEKPTAAGVVSALIPTLYVAVFSCGIAYLLQIIAQRDGDPAIVSLLFSMESVFSVIFGAIVLHQRLTGREYLGCALILAAVIIAKLIERKAENREKTANAN